MKWLGYKQVAVKSIHLDAADIRKRTKAAHVSELAADIRDAGDEPIHAPTIQARTNKLVCGRDRMAAIVILKSKRLWVRVADCTDAEAAKLERRENIYRRPTENRSALLAELVALRTKEIQAGEGRTVSLAPRQSAKAEARRQIARAAGITPAAVKKAEQRAAAKVPPSDGAGAPVSADGRGEAPPEAEATLDLLGCDDASGEAMAKFARFDQAAIDEADKYMRLAQTAIARMAPSTMAQELKADVHRVASRVRAARPESICPWCKGLPRPEAPPCAPCGGLGYVSKEIAGRAPKELLDTSVAPLVAGVDGKFRLYTDVRDGKWTPPKNAAPAKRGKTLTVRTTDGVEHRLDEVDDAEAAY
jgi:hypothetical protein